MAKITRGILFAAALSLAPVCALAASQPPIEIVESTPAGEGLDRAEIRNTRDVWLEIVGGARRTLDLGFFYVEAPEGTASADVVEAVRAAARRGVRVRVIADTTFARGSRPFLDSLEAEANVEVRWWEGRRLVGGGIMHAKYVVADAGGSAPAAYVGSANLDWRSLTEIAEVGVAVRDAEVVGRLEAVFEDDWAACAAPGRAREGRPAPPPPVELPFDGETVGVRVVVSPEGVVPDGAEAEIERLVEMITSAETSIRLAVMKYAPVDPYTRRYDGRLDDAIRAAAGRGVEVRLLVADWAFDRPGLHYLRSLAAVPGIEVRAISFPDSPGHYVPYSRVLHAKFLVVDGARSWVGSSNWEPGYFTECRNVGLVMDGGAFGRALERIHEGLWTHARTSPLRPGDEPPKRLRGERN